MNVKRVKWNIEVEIGYTTYSFDDIDAADLFCRWAVATIDKEYNHHVSMKVDYTMKEDEENV